MQFKQYKTLIIISSFLLGATAYAEAKASTEFECPTTLELSQSTLSNVSCEYNECDFWGYLNKGDHTWLMVMTYHIMPVSRFDKLASLNTALKNGYLHFTYAEFPRTREVVCSYILGDTDFNKEKMSVIISSRGKK